MSAGLPPRSSSSAAASSSKASAASNSITNFFAPRPSRNVVRVNYAEATDESLGAGGAGNGRKKRGAAAFSPAAPRSMPRPKALLKLLSSTVKAQEAGAAGKKAGSKRKASDDSDDEEEEEEEEEEEDEDEAEEKNKAQSIDFSAQKKQQSGPSPKYVMNFVIACEHICERDAALLAAFHAAMVKLLPLNAANLSKIVTAMEGVMTARVVERIQTQLNALGPNGAPADLFLLKSARTPLMSRCLRCNSERHSFLTTMCTSCKKSGQMELMPYLDWRKVVLKQQELDADTARTASKKQDKMKLKESKAAAATEALSTNADSPADSLMASPSSIPSSPSVSLDASPALPSAPAVASNKRLKSKDASTPTTSKSLLPADAALDSIDAPDAKWIENAREQLSLRAIQYIRTCMMKCTKEHFAFSGGDIIFLLRNAIFKGRGEVSKQAREVVSEMIGRWDSTTCTIISDNSEPAHVLVYAECLHAKMEMKWQSDAEFNELVRRLRSAVGAHCAEDILRFDASRFTNTLPTQAYCKPCGEFQKGSKGLCPNAGCGRALVAEEDYEFLCESLVWTSLFRELGLNPVQTADAEVSFESMLRLIKVMRPYRSLENRGLDSYKLQCYFLTHLTFVLTKWGACTMSPRHLFVEEYLFLLSNMDVVIKMKDAELVGEFLQALHILDVPHSHPVMQKGYHFLLGAEKKGTMRGNWVPTSAPFYQRYHAAYCGIIGLAEFEFTKGERFPVEFERFFQ